MTGQVLSGDGQDGHERGPGLGHGPSCQGFVPAEAAAVTSLGGVKVQGRRL
ncbi:hypothetical protein SAMN04489712_101759 [Thermomonospora echinospora]|uniref:Uncharacterized protein n=1 Tax=Thermomonospora echinospora TaxID=1992 RepID=A0A1H5TWX2_9ACTN|nr:hypothetical protein SAMN04489712_101759 [Thermomonospora echinospora]